MASVSSEKSSFQLLHDAPLQGRTTSIDVNFTSHVCGFCATSLGVRSSSRPVHQATGSRYRGLTSWIRRNRRDCYVPLDSWSSTCETLKESGGQSAYVHTLELQLQRYHEEPRKPMDRGNCQGSLLSSWSLVRPCDSAWGPSAFSFMGVQLSGGSTWHPVSGILVVFRGVPEFVSAWHGLCCWGHVDTGSSGGCTTRSGSRTSSTTSIAYTICMQPLLRRS